MLVFEKRKLENEDTSRIFRQQADAEGRRRRGVWVRHDVVNVGYHNSDLSSFTIDAARSLPTSVSGEELRHGNLRLSTAVYEQSASML